MSVKFCPIASGSSGNCIYIGTGKANILIDAGISGISITEGLRRINVSPSDIDAVLVTHDHSDHIKGAGIFSRKFKKPIYATSGTWKVMGSSIGKVAEENIHFIEAGKPVKLKDMEIVPFKIPHDAAEPVGFSVISEGKKVTLATDIGHPTDEIYEMLLHSDIVLLETNHDIDMLNKGSYPYYLKKRILGENGHLCNEVAGEMIAKSCTGRLKHIYLGHLSAENNTPLLAFETVYKILKENGKLSENLFMRCARRSEVSALAEI